MCEWVVMRQSQHAERVCLDLPHITRPARPPEPEPDQARANQTKPNQTKLNQGRRVFWRECEGVCFSARYSRQTAHHHHTEEGSSSSPRQDNDEGREASSFSGPASAPKK